MREQVDLCTTVGKTVEAFVSGSDGRSWLLAFEDGTFSVISIEEVWDPEAAELKNETFDRPEFPEEDMLRLGFVTEEVLREEVVRWEAAMRNNEKRIEAQERAALKRLLAKYGESS